MFLSVTLPVYNVERYLGECIDSILAQTMSDYEILLVDDGSSDNSPQICDYYCQLYPEKIRVIHNSNQGSLLTRRCCLENARGDYIHIMDSDDKLIDIDAYTKIRKRIEDTGSDMVFFRCTRNEETKEVYNSLSFYDTSTSFYDNQIFEGESKRELEFLFVSGTQMNALWNKVFERKLIDYGEDYSAYNDVVNGTDVFQMLPIFSNSNRIVFMDLVLYYYRITEGSIGRKFNSKMFKSIKINSQRLEKYLTIWGRENDPRFVEAFGIKRISGCTTAVNRIRYCKREQRKMALQYLKDISKDPYFIEAYKYHNRLPVSRRIVAVLLRTGMIKPLWFMLSHMN